MSAILIPLDSESPVDELAKSTALRLRELADGLNAAPTITVVNGASFPTDTKANDITLRNRSGNLKVGLAKEKGGFHEFNVVTQRALVLYSVSTGTSGGTSNTAWAQRPLNVLAYNDGSIVKSLDTTNYFFVLVPGEYLVDVDACQCAPILGVPAQTWRFGIQLYNMETAAVASQYGGYGGGGWIDGTLVGGNGQPALNIWASIKGARFNISKDTAFQIRDIATDSRASTGRGRALSVGSIDEIYTRVFINRIA